MLFEIEFIQLPYLVLGSTAIKHYEVLAGFGHFILAQAKTVLADF